MLVRNAHNDSLGLDVMPGGAGKMETFWTFGVLFALDAASDVRLAAGNAASGLLPCTESRRMRASGASQVRF